MAASDEVTSVNSVELKLSADDPLLSLRPELSEDSEIRQLFKQFLDALTSDSSIAVDFLNTRMFILDIMSTEISSQLYSDKTDSTVFQWIYECVTSRNEDLRQYALQFVPDLLMVYMLAVTDNISQVATLAEIALRGISELNSQVQPRIECLSLEKLSVFHEPSFVLLTPSLSESAFSRLSINEVQAIPTNFKGKRIIASNRLSFLSSVIRLLSHYMLSLSDKTRKDFCHFCTRACVRGASSLSFMKETYKMDCLTEDELESMMSQKRINLDGQVLTSLLNGIKKCLFQSCHTSAHQALAAIKFRAEYQLHPQPALISDVLVRLACDITPDPLPPSPSLLAKFSGHQISLTELHKYFNSVATHGNKEAELQRSVSTRRMRLASNMKSELTETDV